MYQTSMAAELLRQADAADLAAHVSAGLEAWRAGAARAEADRVRFKEDEAFITCACSNFKLLKRKQYGNGIV